MPRALRGSTYKLRTKGPDGRPLWAYRLHRGKGGQKGGFRTESEAKNALEAARDELLASRRGDPVANATRRDLTVAELADLYLDSRSGIEGTTKAKLREHLRAATRSLAEGGFGDLRARDLTALDVAKWRSTLPERSAFYYAQALRQLLTWARDVARAVPDNVARCRPRP